MYYKQELYNKHIFQLHASLYSEVDDKVISIVQMNMFYAVAEKYLVDVYFF